MFQNLRRTTTQESSGFQSLYRTGSLYENANARANPELATPGYYSQGPHMIIDNIPENSFPEEIPDEIYSPTRTNSDEPDPFYTVGNIGYIARTNPQLAELVAEQNAADRAAEQRRNIEKVVIPAPVAQKMGHEALTLLEAASSL